MGDNTEVRLLNADAVKGAKNATAEDLMKNSTDVGIIESELYTRATLATLKQTEAGRKNAPLDYNSWNHGDNFTDKSYKDDPKAYAKHPGTNTNSGGSPAGAYQWLEADFDAMGAPDFSPQSQDEATVKHFHSSGRKAARSGNISAFKKAEKGHWTSLQYWSNARLSMEFKKNIVKELNGSSTIATPKDKKLSDINSHSSLK